MKTGDYAYYGSHRDVVRVLCRAERGLVHVQPIGGPSFLCAWQYLDPTTPQDARIATQQRLRELQAAVADTEAFLEDF